MKLPCRNLLNAETQRRLIILIVISASSLHAATNHTSLYNALDKGSLKEQLAFYQLYPETPEGKTALKRSWSLLGITHSAPLSLPSPSLLSALVSLSGGAPSKQEPHFSEESLALIEEAGKTLAHKKLKGHLITNKEQILTLAPEEIDLSRAVLLEQFADDPNPLEKLRHYEASLDLMALQIRAKHPSSPKETIEALNRYLFEEMQFRFPPQSTYVKEIDLYSLLPSVMDSRKGVCLGLSILTFSLAQRLGLSLELVTPPGHIFPRYRDEQQLINIETTVRGIHVPSDTYLSVDTRSLQQRNAKEAIGLVFQNQAAIFWKNEKFEEAAECYKKAALYLGDDLLIQELLAYQLLFTGKNAEAETILKKIQHQLPDYAVSRQTIAEDYLKGYADAAAIQAIFLHTDETQESIQAKQKKIQASLEKFPKFRAGWFHLSICWLQQQRLAEALSCLKRAWELGERSGTSAYYLAALSAERYNYQEAWKYLHAAEKLTQERGHFPRTLKMMRWELSHLCLEP